jgi:hypothetical protein
MPSSTKDSIRPGSRTVTLFNDEHFSILREEHQIPDSFVNEKFKLQCGGAKGGTEMAFVGSQFIIKELSHGDHKTLLEVAESYVKYVRGGDTLLCPVYLHFEDQDSRNFYVMKNMVGPEPFDTVYDLKGCADDKTQWLRGKKVTPVSKRFYKVWMWCGDCAWSKERHIYYDGKLRAQRAVIHVTESQRDKAIATMKKDVEWLMSHQLMDYSLMVATKHRPAGSVTTEFQVPLVRMSPDNTEMCVYIAIIDWLQKWTSSKVVARAIKCLEPDKATIPPDPYGRRFCRRMEERFVVVNDSAASSSVSAEIKHSDISCSQPTVSPKPYISAVLGVIAVLQIVTAVTTLARPSLLQRNSEQDFYTSPSFWAAVVLTAVSVLCILWRPRTSCSEAQQSRGFCSSPVYLVAIILIALMQGAIAYMILTNP